MIRAPFRLAAVLTILALAACGREEASTTVPGGPQTEAEAAAGPAPEMPLDAPPQEEAPPEAGVMPVGAEGCAGEIGAAAASRLVQRCIAVSPATRPPCNVANPCALVQGEIDRSCAQYGPGETRPAECAA